MSHAATDRNLLFGILALQMDFITRDALIQAMHTWVHQKHKLLGQILVEQQVLDADEQALLEALVNKHLHKHGNDPPKSLAAVGSAGSVRRELEQVADSDLQASLVHISSARPALADLDATCDYAVGTPTSSGLRFRILRPHAQGGLGQVFVALDQELHREVALKEIHAEHADHPQHRARFLVEAEVTGSLEHPGIVPVYGLGAYPDGRPFYAMRFIKGDSLKEAIQGFHEADVLGRDPGERSLALRQLLGRFVAVCNAVAYAHSRGVLHRDLKPANVMLGPYGETLVVDWGLAKAAGRTEGMPPAEESTLRPSSADGVTPTQTGQAMGTPQYMSPEQAAGRLDQMGPESDIYSLGATLYCLLTGQVPFTGTTTGEVLTQVQQGAFPPPRLVKPEIPAGLEAVCLKAMALKPQSRYASARGLSDDMEHWLADEPVTAYREPWRVRLGRWVRRHKPAVAAASAAVLAALLLGGLGAWRLEQQLARQRQGVEAALAEVARLQGQARWPEARVALDQARSMLGDGKAEYLRVRLEQARHDLDLVARLDDIRMKKATIVEGKLDIAGADRDYEKAFGEAGMPGVGGDAAAAATWVSSTTVRDALVAALDDWAGCAQERERRVWLLDVARRGDPDPWRDCVRDPAVWDDGAALAQRAGGEAVVRLSPQLLAVVGTRLKGLEKEALLRSAQARYPGDFWINFDLGTALIEAHKPAEAVGYLRAALAVRPGTHPVYNNLGNALRDQNKLDEAVAEYNKAIDLDSRVAPPHYNLGNALRDQDKLDEAVAEYKRAIDLDPKFGLAHSNLAIALRRQGKLDEAIAEYKQAIDLDATHVLAHYNLAIALRHKGKLDEAVAELRKAIAFVSADHPQRPAFAAQLQRCEQMLALDKKLASILRGQAQPSDAAEQLRLAHLCVLKKRYTAAARFFADAFAGQPQLANDLDGSHRYAGACAAAVAAAGQDQDAARLDDQERVRLRQQALGWLQADLALWAKRLENATPQTRMAAQQRLRESQRNSDLATLRDAVALEKLPEAQRAECEKLWAEVEALLKKAGEGGKK